MNFCNAALDSGLHTNTYYSIRDHVKSKLLTVCFSMVKVDLKMI